MPSAVRHIAPQAAESNAFPLSAGCSEAAILTAIGHLIAPPFFIGSASRWHKIGDPAERRLAEAVASVVFGTTAEDALARSVAIEAAQHAATVEASTPFEMARSALAYAADTIGREAYKLAALAAARDRAARANEAEIAGRRQLAVAELQAIEREIAEMRQSIEIGREIAAGRSFLINAPQEYSAATHRKVAEDCARYDIPRLERRRRRAAAKLASIQTVQSGDNLNPRLLKLRAAVKALRRAARDLPQSISAAA